MIFRARTAKECQEIYFQKRSNERPVKAAVEASVVMMDCAWEGAEHKEYYLDGDYKPEERHLFEQVLRYLGFRAELSFAFSTEKKFVYKITYLP